MSAIYILWLRELKRYSRSRAQIIASLAQPLLYLLVLGFGLGPVFRMSGNGSYLQFMAPGVIAMTVLFSAMFSGIGLLWDRQFGFLKETLVAVVCVIAGFRPVSLLQIPAAFGFLALTAIVFAAAGTAIGSTLKDMQGFQMVMNFLVLPLFFLSGALYPLDNLPKALVALTHIDPMTYGVDGLRAALIDRTHFGAPLDALALAGVGAVLTVLGAWRFSRIEV